MNKSKCKVCGSAHTIKYGIRNGMQLDPNIQILLPESTTQFDPIETLYAQNTTQSDPYAKNLCQTKTNSKSKQILCTFAAIIKLNHNEIRTFTSRTVPWKGRDSVG